MIGGTVNVELIVSTIVEFVFLIWGLMVLRPKKGKRTEDGVEK